MKLECKKLHNVPFHEVAALFANIKIIFRDINTS